MDTYNTIRASLALILVLGLFAVGALEQHEKDTRLNHESPSATITTANDKEPTQTEPPAETLSAQTAPVYTTTAPTTSETTTTEPPETSTTPTTPETTTETEPAIEEPKYTAQELEWLALVIYQEAGADYMEDSTRQMVGEVALNRVADSRFPDTLEEVLTQRAQYGCLYWTGLVWPKREGNDIEARAIERAYECAEALLSGKVERLLPTDTIYQAEFRQGTETVVYQDGIYFCR